MRMGASDIKGTSSCYHTKRKVKHIYTHPKYTPWQAYSDVGIAEADQLIVFSSNVRPVCLPYLPLDGDIKYRTDESLTLVGWNYINNAKNDFDAADESNSNIKLARIQVKKPYIN